MSESNIRATNILVVLAALVIVIAGLKLAKDILVPFILATFFAIILAAPMGWLQKKGLNQSLSLIGVMLFSLLLMSLIFITVGSSFEQFQEQLPIYEQKFSGLSSKLTNYLNIKAVDTQSLFNPSKAVGFFSKFLSGVSTIFSQTFLIIFIVIFMLLEISSIDKKLNAISGESKVIASQVVSSIRSYLAIKSIFCLATGVAIWLLAWVLGVPFPAVWGLLAGLLNYIPNIGSILAAVPAVIVALLHGGIQDAAIFAVGIIAVNMVFGNVLEPRYMGKGLGLSVLVVFLSLTFWGWVFGPMGMLLSVPLTMTLKLLLDSKKETQYLAALLSSGEE